MPERLDDFAAWAVHRRSVVAHYVGPRDRAIGTVAGEELRRVGREVPVRCVLRHGIPLSTSIAAVTAL